MLAGVLLGLLAYKPQFGLLIPLALAAGGYWRSFAAAALTVIGLTLVTLALWGPAVWIAFADSLALTRHVVGEDVATGAHKLVSAFAAVRLDGGGIGMAYLVQAIVAVAAAISVVRYAYAQTDARAAIVLCAALLATPYAFDYDLVILGVAIAFLVRGMIGSGALPWEKTLLAIAYASPLLSRPIAALTGIPLGLAGVLIVWGLAIRRAERDQIIAMPPLTCSVCPVT
jgi:hypothetical protein